MTRLRWRLPWRLWAWPLRQATGAGTPSVAVGTEDHAAQLLRDLVAAGVDVCAFAPATGALEETYMSMKVEQP